MDSPLNNYRCYDLLFCGNLSDRCTPSSMKAHVINYVVQNALVSYASPGGKLVNDDNWHHVVVTYDGSSTAAGLNLYIDGEQQAVTRPVDNLTATVIPGVNWRIGSRNGSNFLLAALMRCKYLIGP